mgnify:CR=1 FL=1
MKITLTQDEAALIIANKYNTNTAAVEIVMNTTPTPLGMNYVETILRIVRQKFPNTYQNTQKIAAIKELRTMVPGLGLAEAKGAVERPYEAIDYYLRNNKVMPLSNY